MTRPAPSQQSAEVVVRLDDATIDQVWRRLNAGFGQETTKDQIKAVLWAAAASDGKDSR